MYQRMLTLTLGFIMTGMAALAQAEACYEEGRMPSEIMQCMQQVLQAQEARSAAQDQAITAITSMQTRHLQPLLQSVSALKQQLATQEDRLVRQDQLITATASSQEQHFQSLLASVQALQKELQTQVERLTAEQQSIKTLRAAIVKDTQDLAGVQLAQSELERLQSELEKFRSAHKRQAEQAAKERQRLDEEEERRMISGRYRDNGDGTVTDLETKLMWKRCSEGQKWSDNTCTGDASAVHPNWVKYTTLDLFAGYDNWRLPTKEELLTLVYCSSGLPKVWNNTGNTCTGSYQNPTIDLTAFPSTPSKSFWTSSAYQQYDGSYSFQPSTFHYIYFTDGTIGGHSYDRLLSVRLVRGKQLQ